MPEGPSAVLPADELDRMLAGDGHALVRVPVLVKGRPVVVPTSAIATIRRAVARERANAGPQRRSLLVDDAHVIRRPLLDRATLAPTGEEQLLVMPVVAPGDLVESDPRQLARDLLQLPFDEVLAYVGALRDALSNQSRLIERVAAHTKAVAPIHDRALDALFVTLPRLFDPVGLGEAVDRELSNGKIPGRRFLDGWMRVEVASHRGMMARMADHAFGEGSLPSPPGPAVRAVPTRQLHITAGNSPTIPFVSTLRALATKGAAVVKVAAENTAAVALLAVAMHEVDPSHPITRHISLVYWPGGDPEMERPLLADGAFDRVVVWGSAGTVESVRARAGAAKTIVLNPRVGMSLIGREALGAPLPDVAVRAAADSLVANQRACTSSLVHYVEGTEAEALSYSEELRQVLARWDGVLPHRPSSAAAARLRALRRGRLVGGTWLVNTVRQQPTSVVVYAPTDFDLSEHPMSRCVVVRRVDRLSDALRYISPTISAVGIYPEARRTELRDELAARGVSNIMPLGECERAYAGMPQDGMRLLSELVNWTNS